MSQSAPTRRQRPTPLFALLGLVLLFGLALIPLPGIDQTAALHQLGHASALWVQGLAAWPPAFSPLATGLLGLVVARLAMDLLASPRQDEIVQRLWVAITTGLYIGGTFAGGVALGLTMELRFDHLLVVTDRVVLAGLIAISTTAAAAALWSLATLVKRSGVASGALLLFGAWELTRMGRFLADLGLALFQDGGPEPGLGLMPAHAGLLPIALVALALWRWTPVWGRPILRETRARGPIDLLVFPLAVGGVAATIAADIAGMPPWTPQSPLYDQGLLARTLASLLVVPAIGVWMRRQPGAPGHWGWAVLGFGLLGAVGIGLAVTLSWSGLS